MQQRMLFVLSLLAAFAVYFGYKFSGRSIESAKYSSWDPNFKQSFIESCMESSMDSFLSEGDELKEKYLEYFENYCSCIVDVVENKHIIVPNQDEGREIASDFGQYTEIVNQYFSGQEGKEHLINCESNLVFPENI